MTRKAAPASSGRPAAPTRQRCCGNQASSCPGRCGEVLAKKILRIGMTDRSNDQDATCIRAGDA
ncbi:hypothetical protein C4K40_3038 [Pseudomonas sp. CMR5c]|nr:hypothetical protein C4K40_3038 [Pseudomonas sp. CMR5c]